MNPVRSRSIALALLALSAVPFAAQGRSQLAPRFLEDGARLNGPLQPAGDVSAYAASPDGRWALYLADAEMDEVRELYSVSLRDGSVRKLNGPLVAGGDVTAWHVSPDSRRVVYHADQDVDGQFELYGVPTGGGAAVKVNDTLAPSGDVPSAGSAAISPDSDWVVYRADASIDERYELFRAPLDGGPSVKLSDPLGAGQSVLGFAISPDASRVVFRADARELRAVPLALGAPAYLSPGLQSDIRSVWITPDSTRVVFSTASNVPGVAGAIFGVPIRGGSVVTLSDDSYHDGEGHTIRVTPDSSRVVFVSGNRIRTSLATGGPPTVLVTPVAGILGAAEVSPDSDHVVYLDGEVFGARALYGVPLAGGMPLRLDPGAENPGAFVIAPDSSRVVFGTQADGPDLSSVPPDGGAAAALNSLPGSVQSDFDIGGGGSHVVYRLLTEATTQLYSVPAAGGAVRLRNGPLVPGGNVADFVVRGPWVLYRADQEVDERYELFVSRLEPPY